MYEKPCWHLIVNFGFEKGPPPREVTPVDRTLGPSLLKQGQTFRTNKMYTDAARYYRALLALEPKNALAHNYLGLTHHATRNYTLAEQSFREAMRCDAKFWAAQANLASALRFQKKYPEARTVLNGVLEQNPLFAPAYATLGHLLQDIGDYRGAKGAFTEAARLDEKTYGKLPASLPSLEQGPPPREVK